MQNIHEAETTVLVPKNELCGFSEGYFPSKVDQIENLRPSWIQYL